MKKIKSILEISRIESGDLLLQSFIPALKLRNLDINKILQYPTQCLKSTAHHNQIVSLSGNQIKFKLRMFAVLNHKKIVPGKWDNYQNIQISDYDIIVNPQLQNQSKIKFQDFQQCPSLPGMKFAIWNPLIQHYKYIKINQNKSGNLEAKEQRRQLRGFQARIWDHQVRHLNGILNIAEKICHRQVSVTDQYLCNPGMHQLVAMLKTQLQIFSHDNIQKNIIKQEKTHSFSQIPDVISKQMKQSMIDKYKIHKAVITKHK